jgi:hypothetical protein
VRGTEAVEEVEERNSALDGREVCNGTEVHNFLNVRRAKHSKTCLTASIDIGVVTEDVKSVRSYASCGNVDNAREKLACDLIHIGDHQEKTLRSGISSSESSC